MNVLVYVHDELVIVLLGFSTNEFVFQPKHHNSIYLNSTCQLDPRRNLRPLSQYLSSVMVSGHEHPSARRISAKFWSAWWSRGIGVAGSFQRPRPCENTAFPWNI